MLFRSYKPVRPLSDFIEHFWLYEGYSSVHMHERIFPSGAFELVFNLRGDELRIYKGDEALVCSRYPGALVCGPYHRFFVTDRVQGASAMGVHFRPGGAFPFLGFSAHELADTHLDLATIWGRQAEEIRERLATLPCGQRFRFLERALLSRLRHPFRHHPAVSLAVKGLRSRKSHAIVRTLAREAGVSDRRLIDVFRSEVGLHPKLFHRVQRFQRVLIQLHRFSEPEWEQMALKDGYFDQSHLIRDFRAFSGFSPAVYLRRLQELRSKGLHVKVNHLPVKMST